MQLQRLAPRTQAASIAAVAGLAKFYCRPPDPLSPDQIRSYLHHLLVERRLAWSSCNQVACGLKFFSVTTLGWEALHLHLPPRTGRLPLPHLMSIEALQRLCSSAPTPRHRVLLMTTYAAGLRVGEVVRLRLTDLASDRMLIRVNQGKGRKDRSTLLSARLLAALRAYWTLYRPSLWLFTAQDLTQPMPIATAQTDLLPRQAGRWDHPRHRPPYAAPWLCHASAGSRGGSAHSSSCLLGHRAIATTTRYLPHHPAAPRQGPQPVRSAGRCGRPAQCRRGVRRCLPLEACAHAGTASTGHDRPRWEVADIFRLYGDT